MDDGHQHVLAEGRALPAFGGVLIDELDQLELLGEIVESGGAAKLGETRADGFGLGLLLFGIVIALIAMFGGYRIAGWGSVSGMIATLGIMCGVAVTEELLFRGVLFRLLEKGTGTAVALTVSGLLFGALHLVNPGATLWGALAIAAEAGVLLGAAYTASRRLWLPIGLHLGWNFAESGLFGATDSGSSFHGGLVRGVAHGPAVLSGGGFGPEASIFAVLIGAIASAVLLRRAARAGRIVRAPWRNR